MTVAAEMRHLNNEQRAVVLEDGDAVVFAGPGAGKTKVLVAKAAYLVSTTVTDPQRVACITYTGKAAAEIQRRVHAIAARHTVRIRAGTVHQFCLHHILLPFSDVAGHGPMTAGRVLAEADTRDYWLDAYRLAGLNDDPKWNGPRDTRYRRTLYAGDDLDGFDLQVVRAARHYDELLRKDQRLDFEAMVGRALQILTDRPAVAGILAAQFPWLLVDEYQDLGPVLHRIVMILRATGVRILAVGDGDQTVMGFTGSDPRYLNELPQHGFAPHHLRINYRSGSALVAAAAHILGENRGYRAADDNDEGLVDHRLVDGPIDVHARACVDIARELLARGVQPHQIAVLYPRSSRQAPILDRLREAFTAAGIAVLPERTVPWPRAPITQWLQDAASWQRRRMNPTPDTPTFDELIRRHDQRRQPPPRDPRERLTSRMDLWQALTDAAHLTRLADWVTAVDHALGLSALLAADSDSADRTALDTLTGDRYATSTVAEFAGDAEATGKIAITTYHSAKGREWPYVILPSLEEGMLPRWERNRPPSMLRLVEERRLFYVAITRAKSAAILLHPPVDPWTDRLSAGQPSRFLAEMHGSAAADL